MLDHISSKMATPFCISNHYCFKCIFCSSFSFFSFWCLCVCYTFCSCPTGFGPSNLFFFFLISILFVSQLLYFLLRILSSGSEILSSPVSSLLVSSLEAFFVSVFFFISRILFYSFLVFPTLCSLWPSVLVCCLLYPLEPLVYQS